MSSLPVSVLLGVAALVWLAGAWLAGSADAISEVGSPMVVPVVSTMSSVGADGSDDKNAAGGAPKSAAPSQPQGNNNSSSSGSTGGSTNSDSTPKQPGAARPPADQGQGGQTQAHPAPAPVKEGQPAPDQGGAVPVAPAGKPPSEGSDSEQGGTVKPAARPGDASPGRTVVRPAGLTRRPEPGDGTPGAQPGAAKTGQPGRPDPDCASGTNGCGGGAPAVPPNPAPVPSSAQSGGGTTSPGGGGAQPGTEDNGWFGSYLNQLGKTDPQQPGGLVPKDKAPHSGLDPPAARTGTDPLLTPLRRPGSDSPGAQGGATDPLTAVRKSVTGSPGADDRGQNDALAKVLAPWLDPDRGGSGDLDQTMPLPARMLSQPLDKTRAGQQLYQDVLGKDGKAADRLRGLSPGQLQQLVGQGPPRTAEDVINAATGTRPAAPGTSDEWDRQQAIKDWFAGSRSHPADFDAFAQALPPAERDKLNQIFEDNKPSLLSPAYLGQQLEDGIRAGWDLSDKWEELIGARRKGQRDNTVDRSVKNLIAGTPSGLGKLVEDADASRSFDTTPLIGETPEHADRRLHPIGEDFKQIGQGYGDELGPLSHGDPGPLLTHLRDDPAGTLARYAPVGQLGKLSALKGAGALKRLGETGVGQRAIGAAKSARDPVTGKPAPPAEHPVPPGAAPNPGAGVPAVPSAHAAVPARRGAPVAGSAGRRPAGQPGTRPIGAAGVRPGQPTAAPGRRAGPTDPAQVGAGDTTKPLVTAGGTTRRAAPAAGQAGTLKDTAEPSPHKNNPARPATGPEENEPTSGSASGHRRSHDPDEPDTPKTSAPGYANRDLRGQPQELTRDDLSPSQLANLKRYSKKLPASAEATSIKRLADKSIQFETRVPGRVPGSYALYTKTIDEAGTTVGYTKKTVLPDGSVAHVKDKLARNTPLKEHPPSVSAKPRDPNPREIQNKYGIRRKDQKKFQDYADRLGIAIDVRPVNPASLPHLRHNQAIPKPQSIKSKTVNRYDVILKPELSGREGQVGYFDPGSVPPRRGNLSQSEWNKINARYEQRKKEQVDYREKMSQLQGAGEIRLDGGVVWGRDAGGRWKPYAGDNDIYDIRIHPAGHRLSTSDHDDLIEDMKSNNMGVNHGAHMYWRPKDSTEQGIFDVIVGNHRPGGEPLVRFAPKSPPSLVDGTGEPHQ